MFCRCARSPSAPSTRTPPPTDHDGLPLRSASRGSRGHVDGSGARERGSRRLQQPLLALRHGDDEPDRKASISTGGAPPSSTGTRRATPSTSSRAKAACTALVVTRFGGTWQPHTATTSSRRTNSTRGRWLTTPGSRPPVIAASSRPTGCFQCSQDRAPRAALPLEPRPDSIRAAQGRPGHVPSCPRATRQEDMLELLKRRGTQVRGEPLYLRPPMVG